MALKADLSHYNAWWGLGNISLKQEKFPEAHQYFERAKEINQRSAVLWTYLGMTLSNCDEAMRALQCFEAAEQLDPKRPLTKYQKVTVLMALNRHTESLEVLQELKNLCPKEAPIYVTMGKIYKKLGDKKQAL